MTPPEGWRPWVVRAGALVVAGVIGGGTVGALAGRLPSGGSAPLALMAATGAAAVVVLPLWGLVLRNGRRGPAWGAVVAASGPVVVTAVLAGVTLVSIDGSVESVLYDAALFQLLQLPVTVAAAVTGALLETDRVSAAFEDR